MPSKAIRMAVRSGWLIIIKQTFSEAAGLAQRLANIRTKGVTTLTRGLEIQVDCSILSGLVKNCFHLTIFLEKKTSAGYLLKTKAEVFYYVNYVNINYSVKNLTADCKYLLYFLMSFQMIFKTISYIGIFCTVLVLI